MRMYFLLNQSYMSEAHTDNRLGKYNVQFCLHLAHSHMEFYYWISNFIGFMAKGGGVYKRQSL